MSQLARRKKNSTKAPRPRKHLKTSRIAPPPFGLVISTTFRKKTGHINRVSKQKLNVLTIRHFPKPLSCEQPGKMVKGRIQWKGKEFRSAKNFERGKKKWFLRPSGKKRKKISGPKAAHSVHHLHTLTTRSIPLEKKTYETSENVADFGGFSFQCDALRFTP